MSRNSLIAAAFAHWPMQDNAADAVVANANGVTQAALLASTTAAISAADGPNATYPRSLELRRGGTVEGIDSNLTNNTFSGDVSWAAWYKPKVTVSYLNDVQTGRIVAFDGEDRSSFISANGDLTFGGFSVGVNRNIFAGHGDVSTWQHVGFAYNATTQQAKVYLNGVSVGGGPKTYSGPTWPSAIAGTTKIGCHSLGSATASGYHADHAVWQSVLSDADFADLFAGHEPTYSGAGVTLSQSGVVDVDEANWDDRGNGGLTFDVAVHVNDVETEVINDYVGGSILDGLTLSNGDEIYAVVRALNNGDDDPNENQTTNTIVYSSGLAAKYHHYRQLMSA